MDKQKPVTKKSLTAGSSDDIIKFGNPQISSIIKPPSPQHPKYSPTQKDSDEIQKDSLTESSTKIPLNIVS